MQFRYVTPRQVKAHYDINNDIHSVVVDMEAVDGLDRVALKLETKQMMQLAMELLELVKSRGVAK